jgi:hypothetical protein
MLMLMMMIPVACSMLNANNNQRSYAQTDATHFKRKKEKKIEKLKLF